MRTHHYFIALLIAGCIGIGAMAYKTTLLPWIEDDDVDLILSEQAKADPSFPDRALVSAMGYDMYVWPKLVYHLEQSYPIETYTLVLIGISTSLTVFCAYAALIWLGFSPFVAFGTALVALLPRFAPADTFGGLLVSVTGRSFAIPLVWLLSAWYLRRWHAGKSLWPVFFGVGIAGYVHPVSMVTFVVVLTLVHGTVRLIEGEFRAGFYEFIKQSLAFMTGAAGILYEVLVRGKSIVAPVTERIISATEYLTALRARNHYEFIDTSIDWFWHEFIISALFLICGLYVWRLIRERVIARDTIEYRAVLFGTLVSLYAFIVHLVVPAFQLFMVRTFDAPFLLWNFCRTFKYVYLGLLFIYVVALKEVYVRYGRYWALLLVGAGMLSSSYSFEWAQYLVGFPNYQKEYVPAAWQSVEYPDPNAEYARWCATFRDVGVKEGDIVLSQDYLLRYFCKIRPHVTREEGYAHIFMGRESLVDWYEELQIQNGVLTGTSTSVVLWYAQLSGATAAVLPRESVAVAEFMENGTPVAIHRTWAVVGLR